MPINKISVDEYRYTVRNEILGVDRKQIRGSGQAFVTRQNYHMYSSYPSLRRYYNQQFIMKKSCYNSSRDGTVPGFTLGDYYVCGNSNIVIKRPREAGCTRPTSVLFTGSTALEL